MPEHLGLSEILAWALVATFAEASRI